MSQEKKPLLKGGDPEPPTDEKYDQVNEQDGKRPQNKIMGFLYDHRKTIPGYQMISMIRNVGVYSLYVLFVLLLAYLLNQLDRYTLPIVTSSAGYDLHYGDLVCMKTKSLSDVFEENNITSSITDICTNKSYYLPELNESVNVKTSKHYCLGLEKLTFTDTNTTYHVCEFSHGGKGLEYQIVAGPVFNNLYPFAGIFTGFLADYGRRTIWLVVSLVFWSVITGVTGLVRNYWQLVITRSLLAIGAAGCSPFAVSLIGDYFPAEYRGSAIGVYYWGIYIGYSLAFAIGNGIDVLLNWRWVFFISGIAGILVAPLILFTVREPKRKKNPLAEESEEKNKLDFKQRLVILIRTFIMPSMLAICIAGGVRNAGGYVWAYNTELFFEDSYSKVQISRYMSWIPLVGGSLGAVVGGVISDILVKGRGPYMRIWVIIVSQILAAPFAAGALFLPHPWCFLTLIPSNVIGEMWIGVTTAIVVDLAPSKIRTSAVALYLFIITVIGGNFNLLVTPIQHGFEHHGYSEHASYQWALFLTFPGTYALSSLLFLVAFFLMRFDLKQKKRLEEKMIVNESDGVESSNSTDGGDGDFTDKPAHQLETSYSGSDN